MQIDVIIVLIYRSVIHCIMVNTFLPYADFEKCAKLLDYRRLGNQRREAKLIIQVLLDYQVLAQFYNYPYCSGSVHTYLSNLREFYLSQNYRFRRHGRLYIQIPLNLLPLYDKSEIIKLGYGLHAAVRMWFGYTYALKHYYNTIIDEWVRRGYVNNMSKYNIVDKIIYPPWFGDENFHNSHRSVLLAKNPNYYKFDDIIIVPDCIWPIT